MEFDPEGASELLAACHRRCCVCHRFCGIKMELDHIEQRADQGSDKIDNAIPVCFECHAEIHLYNDKHPRGRKFRPRELRLHKKQWLSICKNNPLVLVDNPRVADVGPLHSLIDELEFNATVSSITDKCELGCLFEVRQFDRALQDGLISILEPEVRDSLYKCYHHLKRANQRLQRAVHAERSDRSGQALYEAQPDVIKAGEIIQGAICPLLKFLSGSDVSTEDLNSGP